MRVSSAILAAGLTAILAVVVLVPEARAAEIVGRVTNATTSQAVPGQSVNLLALRAQMVPIRETQTDSEGRFRFVVDANPSERFLVQVPFRGVNYNAPAAFSSGERITADVTVYETGAAAADISVQAHTIFIEAHSGHVRVSDFYSVENRSRPPRAYAPERGSFRFTLPGPVGDLQISAVRSGGMPLRQQPQPAEVANTFVVDFPLHPGETEFQVSYALPLGGTALDLELPLGVVTARRHLAVPRQGVRVEGAGLKEIVQTQAPQARVYEVEARAPGNLKLHLEVDPAAVAAAPEPSTPAAPQGENAVSIIPHPVNQAQWYIVGLTLLVLLLGLYYLSSLDPALRGKPSGRAPTATNEPARQPGRRPAH